MPLLWMISWQWVSKALITAGDWVEWFMYKSDEEAAILFAVDAIDKKHKAE